jgi:hypothetical protein
MENLLCKAEAFLSLPEETEKGHKSSKSLVTLKFLLEAATGFEPVNNGFADRRLTTWLCRRWSGKRDLNPRLQPWQGCTLPLSYSRASSTHLINLQDSGRVVKTRSLRKKRTGDAGIGRRIEKNDAETPCPRSPVLRVFPIMHCAGPILFI